MSAARPPSVVELRALAQRGIAFLQAGQVAGARDIFGKLVQLAPDQADGHLGLAHALRGLGQAEPANAALDKALSLQPRHIGALVLKGDWLDAAGQATAASFYQAAVRCAEEMDTLPQEWALQAEHAQRMCERYALQFEQALRGQLEAVAPKCGGPSDRFLQSLELLSGRRQVFASAPRLYLFPELPTVQFFSREAFPWLAQLEAATPLIRNELLALLGQPQVFRPYVESDRSRPVLNPGGLLDNPDWSACFLWKNGVRHAAIADRCPATEAALAQVPVVHIPGRSPSVLFSLMRPGAHIPPHHGFVNTRLIVHLPLVVPPGCRFRVGNETREWVEGKAWLFDDTIEHEAWNPSDQTRVVLLLEVWRPELDVSERAHVSALFEAIEKQRGSVGEWGI